MSWFLLRVFRFFAFSFKHARNTWERERQLCKVFKQCIASRFFSVPKLANDSVKARKLDLFIAQSTRTSRASYITSKPIQLSDSSIQLPAYPKSTTIPQRNNKERSKKRNRNAIPRRILHAPSSLLFLPITSLHDSYGNIPHVPSPLLFHPPSFLHATCGILTPAPSAPAATTETISNL